MLSRLRVRNFKRLDDVDIELGNAVVFIGPNNSGKTAALQALSLWEAGLRRWNEKREGKSIPAKRSGVTINRLELISVPVPRADLLWRDLHVRDVHRDAAGKQRTDNVYIEIVVEGITDDVAWECGFEFYYANPESLYCRPLRRDRGKPSDAMAVPPEAATTRVAFLPPMSGLAAVETKLEPGRINVLIGEGQTAQVLRNLCYQIHDSNPENPKWRAMVAHMHDLFGIELRAPEYIEERGEIRMAYRDVGGTELDLSCSGRGVQQTLLVLAHLYANPGAVLLLDEPDAHLEILRQRQTYNILTEVAAEQSAQVIAASHSEVILNEAADRDMVVAFVGKPHRIDDRGSQVLKSLRDIGFEDYYLAETRGWVLYLEGSTDLRILQTFAASLNHPAQEYLKAPFVRYVGNDVSAARRHFHGLREACPELPGIALFDRLERAADEGEALSIQQWSRREIENYFCTESVLLAYAASDPGEAEPNLFSVQQRDERLQAMRDAVAEVTQAVRVIREASPWSEDVKATDDFLDPLFRLYFQKLSLPNLFDKSDYHVLAGLLPVEQIDPEVTEKLDAIVRVAEAATPRSN